MRLALSQNNYATMEMRKKLSYRGNYNFVSFEAFMN